MSKDDKPAPPADDVEPWLTISKSFIRSGKMSELSDGELRVALIVASFVNTDPSNPRFGTAWPSIETIAKLMPTNKADAKLATRMRRVRKILVSLDKKGIVCLVEKGRRHNSSTRTVTILPGKLDRSRRDRSKDSDRSHGDHLDGSDRDQLDRSDGDPLRRIGKNNTQERESLSPDEAGPGWIDGAKWFDEFWAKWPEHHRKRDRANCQAFWIEHDLGAKAEQIAKSLKAFTKSPDWVDDGGRFIPTPLRWLKDGSWQVTPKRDTHAPPAKSFDDFVPRRLRPGELDELLGKDFKADPIPQKLLVGASR